ncbi:MAG: TIGR02444 family protein [Rhodospirillaceae bacterium]|nr:TIGR02444 family protein [Rhodospirillaceae bacterium]
MTLYARPGVAPACLHLQERHGVDVNALLFCLWLGASGRGPAADEALAAAFDAAEAWHAEVVRSLRAVRKRLKTAIGPVDGGLAQALRSRLQALEIDAEHIEQLALAAAPAATAPADTGLDADARAGHAARHAAGYFRRLGARLDGSDIAALRNIMAAAFALPEASLQGHLERGFA